MGDITPAGEVDALAALALAGGSAVTDLTAGVGVEFADGFVKKTGVLKGCGYCCRCGGESERKGDGDGEDGGGLHGVCCLPLCICVLFECLFSFIWEEGEERQSVVNEGESDAARVFIRSLVMVTRLGELGFFVLLLPGYLHVGN